MSAIESSSSSFASSSFSAPSDILSSVLQADASSGVLAGAAAISANSANASSSCALVDAVQSSSKEVGQSALPPSGSYQKNKCGMKSNSAVLSAIGRHPGGISNVVDLTGPVPNAQGGRESSFFNDYSSASLYVGDLHSDVTEAMLYEVFNSVGPVASIRVCRDATSRKSLGYAYVNYHVPSDAERALDTLNYTPIRGIAMRIMWSRRDPTLRRSGAGNVFVKNLDRTIDNNALYDTFSLFGNILSCKVKTDASGRSLGFGFVHYENDEAAQTAINRVNGMLIGNKTVFVGRFLKKSERSVNQPSQESQKFTNIYIKNIPHSWTESKLKDIFSKFGTITSMAMRLDGKNRKFGFINFESFEDAKNAIESLNNSLVDDHGLLEEEEKQEEKSKELNGASKKEKKKKGKKEEKEKSEEQIRLFVCPHQSKLQRSAMLKAKYESTNPVNNNDFSNSNIYKSNKVLGLNLYIKNLDDSINDEELRQLFEQFGSVTSAKVMKDEKNVSRGFGFVCFSLPEEASKAVTKMHLKLVHNKPLYVGLAEKRDQRLANLQQRYKLVLHPQMKSGSTAANAGGLSGVNMGGGGGLSNAAGGGGMHNGFGGRIAPHNASAFGGGNMMGVMAGQGKFPAAPQHQMFFGNGSSAMRNNNNNNEVQQQPPPRVNQVTSYPHVGGGGLTPWRTQNVNLYNAASGGGGGGGGSMKLRQLNGPNMEMPPCHLQQQQQHNNIMGGGTGGVENFGGFMHSKPHMNFAAGGRGGGGAGGMRVPRAANMMGASGAMINKQQVSMNNHHGNNINHLHKNPNLAQSGVSTATSVGGNNLSAASFQFTPQARNKNDSSCATGMMQPNSDISSSVRMPHLPVSCTPHGAVLGHPGSAPLQPQSASTALAGALDMYHQGITLNNDISFNAAAFAAAGPTMQKQIIGEKLFPLVARFESELAGKITGMMLEMDNSELLYLIESESQLKAKVHEALRVLQQASQEH